ncbi:hypothetical protein AB0F91_44635 [Amycolatopsis sp. NPDC023774]|uniref:hypothetical protein n=1 Tax=Amycolatopsis sp. NPDC023774 TaxID=3155015 RepID=UPI0033CB8B88
MKNLGKMAAVALLSAAGPLIFAAQADAAPQSPLSPSDAAPSCVTIYATDSGATYVDFELENFCNFTVRVHVIVDQGRIRRALPWSPMTTSTAREPDFSPQSIALKTAKYQMLKDK